MGKSIITLIFALTGLSRAGYAQNNLEYLTFKDSDIPLAPKEYRRPEGTDPGDDYNPALYRYPYSLKNMQEKFSEKMMQDAAKEYARMTEVNNNGRWKPEWQSLEQHNTPEWFSDVKFGMFVDWGLWSVAGYTLLLGKDKAVYPDWYEYQMVADNDGPRRYDKHRKVFSLKQYHEKNWGTDFARGDFIPLFTAEEFNPDKLTDLAVEAGMKYIVPFCKHFSGWCIWPSSYTHMDVGERLGKDIMQPLVDNCRKKDLKFGFYYGTQEWEYPIIDDKGGLTIRNWFRMGYSNPAAPYTPDMENLIPGKIPVKNFIRDYIVPQAVEFIDKYDPDILWYDGDWDTSAEELGSYEISAYFYNKAEGRKQVAVNDRYGLKKEDRRSSRSRLGDIFTSEHHSIAESKKNGNHAWEENRGISSSFGFNWQDTDENVISSKEFIDMFVNIVSEGGNLLLIVNPDGKGALPEVQEKRLKDIGKWLKVNGEGIYYTRPYITSKENNIRYTRSKDNKTVYAISTEWAGKQLELKSVEPAKDSEVYMLGYDKPLKWSYKNGTTTILLPAALQKEENRPCRYAYTFKIVLPIQYVKNFDNVNHPQILYWFWDDATIENRQYLKDIDKMAEKSPFDMVMLTSRFSDDIGFWNTERMKPHLAEAVDYAHKRGIKVVLQLWPLNRTTELEIYDYPIETKDAEALMVERECSLNAAGKGSVILHSNSADKNRIIHAETVKVWLFRKTTDGFYDPSTLIEADPAWISSHTKDIFAVKVVINAPEKYAGYTASVMTKTYYHFFDVRSPKHFGIFKKMLDDYSSIPFDGAALDENGNMSVNSHGYWLKNNRHMEERTWCDEFENHLRRIGIDDPVRLLFDMRYAPENHPEVRIKAINRYFEEMIKGALPVENAFYDYVKKLFGKDAFIGCHSTFHNTLNGLDVWTTGLDWWDLPREYGQTDEYQSMPDRMGIGISGTHPVMYNMFYHRNKETMLTEAIVNASFGVRQHYHAWNDVQGWGKDVRDDDFLADLAPVEQRIRLLNRFNPAPPKIPILLVYGFPYQLNWYPDKNEKGWLGVRDFPKSMQQQANDIWRAGYPCAAIPSTWIDRGMATIRKDGKVQVKDRVFDAVIFLYPQYSKPSTLAFLKELTGKKGHLMIAGDASIDFYGNDCSEEYKTIAQQAIPFDIAGIEKLEVLKNPVEGGTFLQDGSVVLSDYKSIKDKSPTNFKVKIGKDEYVGSYEGVFALKTDKNGQIEKMVCGNFQSLQKNGQTILEIKTPADISVSTEKGKIQITLKGNDNTVIYNKIHK